MRKYDPELAEKPRWLVLNKIDTIEASERQARIDDFVRRFRGRGRSALPVSRVFAISGLTREGCEVLVREVESWLAAQREPQAKVVDPRFADVDGASTP